MEEKLFGSVERKGWIVLTFGVRDESYNLELQLASEVPN